jgi:regulator of replication initiation timing
MQPDLLIPEKEENQPEPLAIQEETSSQPLFTPEAAQQPAPAPVNEPTPVKPSPTAEKKRAKLNVAAIILGVIVFFLLLGVAGLGYGVYVLRAELISTQQQLAALQGEHGKLQTDYTALTTENEKLNAELTQSKADLEKTNADLTTAQADLKKSQDQNSDLNAKIDKASKLANVLYSWFTSKSPSDMFKIDTQIKDARDTQLTSLWNKFTNSPSEAKFGDLMIYLATALHNGLK